jgi:predicted acyl esterase
VSTAPVLTGQLIDAPIAGLTYRTPTVEGETDREGRFTYRDGEEIEFSLGALALGSARGAAEVTSRDFARAAAGLADPELTDPDLTNRARFMQSLAAATGTGQVAVARLRDSAPAAVDFGKPEADFGVDDAVADFLGGANTPLVSPAEARNELRRAIAGIVKLTDVRIPTRDGSYLLADVFTPRQPGRYPVLLRLSVYGRAFGMGSIVTEDDRVASETREDQWFEQPRDALPGLVRYAENAVSANTSDWVPRGYVCVRVDSRGVGRTPGTLAPFSPQEAQDYYDAIEWAAQQDWSDGNVGLYGSSYTGTTQWNVAILQPPSLKAMMPWAADGDAYRELAYPGGILAEGYRRNWWTMVTTASPASTHSGFYDFLEQHPFDDPAAYGPAGQIGGSDYPRVTVPALVAVSQGLYLHARGGFEAFEGLPSPDKRLVVSAADYFPFMYSECLAQEFAFFDRHLKGRPADSGPPVRIAVRTGGTGFTWRDSDTWPPATVTSRTYYLDAATGSLEDAAPLTGSAAEYSADPAQTGGREFAGVSFLTEPADADLDVIGHTRATLWVSSSSPDMDVFVALRVIGPDGTEHMYAADPREPMTNGALKVSHRATDPERSNARRPWHTHRAEDVQLLSPGEVVEVEVEIMGVAARIPAGGRLRLDIHPIERNGDPLGGREGFQRAYDHSYHDGALNQVHTGPDFPSHLVIPVLPVLG